MPIYPVLNPLCSQHLRVNKKSAWLFIIMCILTQIQLGITDFWTVFVIKIKYLEDCVGFTDLQMSCCVFLFYRKHKSYSL